jgi:lysophospholipase L1-like esterase
MNAHRPNSRIAAQLVVAGLTSFLLVAGCAQHSPTAPTPGGPPSPGSAVTYAAIGASDATGHGASVECLVPFADCPDGTGYVPLTGRLLKAQGFTVTVTNLGIPTAVIGRDFQNLGQQYNRLIAANYIESEAPFVPRNTNVVTIFAGGNEVNTITAALGAGAGSADPAAYIDAQVKAFGADFSALLSTVQSRATGPRIVVLNLPNLAGLPYLATVSPAQRQAAQRAAVGMTTTVINPLTAQGIVVVDLMCDPRAYQASNYFSDGFHPNDAGYAFIAAEVMKAITASYPSPRANCAQMTLVP